MNLLSAFARRVPALLFWPWNIVLCCVMVAGYLPLVMVQLVVDAAYGLARLDFVFGSLVMVLVPPLCLIHAIQHRHAYKDDPWELASFFFGVELPLLACTGARLFGFQQLTGAAELVYLAIIVGGVVAETRVIFGERLPRGQLVDGVLHAILVLRLVAGTYTGFLLASLSVPLLALGLATVLNANPDAGSFVAAVIFSPLLLFALASVLLVLLLPITAPLAWLRGVVRSGRELRAAWGWDDLFFTTAGPVVAGTLAFVLMLPQPHTDALQALNYPPQNDAERRALAQRQDAIGEGLLDAYLGRHSYLGDDRVNAWSELWSLENKLVPSYALRDVDAVMQTLARPFVYEGSLDDAVRAQQLYRDFFGRELERDHAEAVRSALAATWSREERFAGFINEGQQRVRLEQQDLRIEGNAGVFDVEIHDVWTNQTANDEEVAIFFELPESAAVTGLWLGPTANRDEAFKYVTAPRGAAQQVYNEEVRARRDPALLEQVGPRQYRLRVFPVPARPERPRDSMLASGWNDTVAPRVHVWVTYQTLPDDDGLAPLPRLRERRNGFWDPQTIRFVNGEAVEARDAVRGGGWVQASSQTLGATRQQRQTVAASLRGAGPGGSDGCLVMLPAPAAPLPSLVGKTVDVVIDRSLELDAHRPELQAALLALRSTGATLRVVLGSSSLRGEEATAVDAAATAALANVVDVDQLVFFGAARPKELLRQLLILRTRANLPLGDVVVILAGSASFDTADDVPLALDGLPNVLPNKVLPPTVLVHVTGTMPAGYDDASLDAIRRSGGTATDSIVAGLSRLGQQVEVDGYQLDVTPGPTMCSKAPTAVAVLARQHILRADRGGLAPVEALDGLHRVAVTGSVVTPYSSMIVLVDARQRARLAQLSEQQDRFDREVEKDAKGAGAVAPTAVNEPPPPPSSPEAKKENAPKSKADVSSLAVPVQSPQKLGDSVADNALAASEQALAPSLATSPTTPTAQTPPDQAPTATVSGVPEPEEWLLLLLGMAVVAVETRRRLQARQRG